MNIKRFIIAGFTIFVSFQVLDFFVHQVILASAYQTLINVWRPDMMEKMWVMTLSSLILSFLFVYIFTKGYAGEGIIEGVRYGLLIGLFMNIPAMLNQYVVYPIPFSLVSQWFLFGTIEFILCGVIVSLIYKPKAN